MNKLIDHTLLRANATKKDIIKLCQEAKNYSFKSVCVNPFYVALATKSLKDTDVLVCTVIGFPLGANMLETKINETKAAVKDGANEIDMVINIGQAIDHNWDYILNEIEQIRLSCDKKILKVIIETCYLNDEEIVKLSELAEKGKADFVKTSTGFGTAGAKEEDVLLIKKAVKTNIGIKASGGIKNTDDLKRMINAGATRIGTSNGINIIKGDNNGNSSY